MPKIKTNEKEIKNIVYSAMEFDDVGKAIEFIKDQIQESQTIKKTKTTMPYALIKFHYTIKTENYIEQALQVGKYLYENYSDFWIGCLAYADILGETKQYELGIAVIASVKNFRFRSDLWHQYCFLLAKNGQIEEALKEFRNLAVEHRTAEILFAYTVLLSEYEYIDEAEIAYEDCISAFPTHWRACFNYGCFLQYEIQDNEKSIKFLNQALEVGKNGFPRKLNGTDIAKIFHQLGLNYIDLFNYKEAEKFFEKAIKADKKYAAAFSALKKTKNEDHLLKNKKGALHYKGQKKSFSKFYDKEDLYRQAYLLNPPRWNVLHAAAYFPTKLVSIILAEYGKNDETEFKLIAAAAYKNGGCEFEDKNERHRSAKKKLPREYQIKLEEINKLKKNGIKELGEEFEIWFQMTFETKPDGTRGLLSQAEALSTQTLYMPAIKKLDEILAELPEKIEELRIKLEERKKAETMASSDSKNGPSQKMEDGSIKTHTRKRKSATHEQQFKEMGSNTNKQNNSDHQKTTQPMLATKFWKAVSQCCFAVDIKKKVITLGNTVHDRVFRPSYSSSLNY